MSEDSGRTAFLDLVIQVLAEHEKALSELVDRLERLTAKIETLLGDSEEPCWSRVFHRKGRAAAP